MTRLRFWTQSQEREDRQTADSNHYEILANYFLRYTFPGVRRSSGDFAIHRRMRPSHDWNSRNYPLAGSLYLYDRIAAHLSLAPSPLLLDAGCGFGAGTSRLNSLVGGTAVGISDSKTQIEIAKATYADSQHESISFEYRSFDDLVGRFSGLDAVVAVESLVHSVDLRTTLSEIAQVLSEGGLVAIVDDVAASSIAGPQSAVARLRTRWGVTTFWTADDYREGLAEAGLEITNFSDWSADVVLMPRFARSLAVAFLHISRTFTSKQRRPIFEFHLGQLDLHARYRRGEFSYVFMTAVKRRTSSATQEE